MSIDIREDCVVGRDSLLMGTYSYKFPFFKHFLSSGSGIVMSLGAMLILEKAHDKCMIKFKDCWAGDVRLGQCLA